MTRPARLLLAVTGAAVALSVSACGTPNAGAAAKVGDVRISVNELREAVERGLANPAAAERNQEGSPERAQYQQQTLARLIDAVLLDRIATDEGITVTEQQVNAEVARYAARSGGRSELLRQAAEAGVAEADVNPFFRSLLLRDLIADKLTADLPVPEERLRAVYEQSLAEYDQVRAAHILVPDEPTAERVAREVRADPSRFSQLAQELSTDTSNKDKGGDLGYTGRGTFVPEFERAIFAASPGQIVGPVRTQFGFHVIRVLDRRTTTFEQARLELRRRALENERPEALTRRLAEEAREAGVSVSQRFGRWDAASGQVVDNEDRLSTVPTQGPGEAGGGEPQGGDPAQGGGAPQGGDPAQGGGAPVEPSPASS